MNSLKLTKFINPKGGSSVFMCSDTQSHLDLVSRTLAFDITRDSDRIFHIEELLNKNGSVTPKAYINAIKGLVEKYPMGEIEVEDCFGDTTFEKDFQPVVVITSNVINKFSKTSSSTQEDTLYLDASKAQKLLNKMDEIVQDTNIVVINTQVVKDPLQVMCNKSFDTYVGEQVSSAVLPLFNIKGMICAVFEPNIKVHDETNADICIGVVRNGRNGYGYMKAKTNYYSLCEDKTGKTVLDFISEKTDMEIVMRKHLNF